MMKSSKRPRYSVVIPCYNEANYIDDTLASLKAQKIDASYEVIVVDNNCTDDTVAIASRYDTTIVFTDIPGVCAARQAGTTAARGDIVISTDADTTFSPGWLQHIDDTFKDNPHLVAVGGPCRFVDGPWWGNFYTYILFDASFVYNKIFGHPLYMTATNIAFRKTAWEGYDIKTKQAGDELGLLHQLRRHGKVSFSLSNPTYTSSRRLTRGLFYNIFVTSLYYYFAGYYVNHFFGREIIGRAPVIRTSETASGRFLQRIGGTFMTLAVLGLSLYGFNKVFGSFISDNAKDAANAIIRYI